jgi:ketosteroid isomerase-like protein
MSEQDVESLRGAYRDFNAGKPETVLAMADENVEWTEPGGGNAPVGTFTGGRAGIRPDTAELRRVRLQPRELR